MQGIEEYASAPSFHNLKYSAELRRLLGDGHVEELEEQCCPLEESVSSTESLSIQGGKASSPGSVGRWKTHLKSTEVRMILLMPIFMAMKGPEMLGE